MAGTSTVRSRTRSSKHPRRVLSEFMAEIGRKGGRARASALTAEQRVEIANNASQAAARARSEKVRVRRVVEAQPPVLEPTPVSSAAVQPAINPVRERLLKWALLKRQLVLTRRRQFGRHPGKPTPPAGRTLLGTVPGYKPRWPFPPKNS
jgi:hypothetical protein